MPTKWCKKLEVAYKRCQISRSHRTKSHRFWPKLAISRLLIQFEFTDGNKMMHKAWSSRQEVPCCFLKSSLKFQGHTKQKITDFDLNWAFPDCNSSLNSPMALKGCTKLEIGWKRCRVIFQGHPSNFKVTWGKKSPILTQIERFWTVTPVWVHWWILNDAQSLV